MRWTVAGFAVLALGFWSIWSASFTVEPDSVAVVTRDDRIVRIVEPGLRWRLPLVEQVGFVPIFRQYRQSLAIEARLADGSSCRIAADIFFTTPDARLAFAWRKKHGLSVSKDGSRDDGAAYTEAAQAFRSAAVSALRAISAGKARNGTVVSEWIRAYRSPVHADGSQVQGVQPVRVDCESKALADQLRPKPEPPEYGALRPFSRTLARPATGLDTALRLELEEQEMPARNGRIRLPPLLVLYVIGDEQRFIERVGTGERGRRNAALRIGHIMNSQLRRVIGLLEIDDLTTFDPLSVAFPGTDLAKQLDRLGVRIVDVGGNKTGYRIAKNGR